MTIPLSFAYQDMGALTIMCDNPAHMDKYLRKLSVELSLVLARILYTKSCLEQLRAGEQIIHDVMPRQVGVLAQMMLMQ